MFVKENPGRKSRKGDEDTLYDKYSMENESEKN